MLDHSQLRHKKKLLITGYGPFRNYSINPSWEAVKKIDPIPGWEITKLQLDVDYQKVTDFIYPPDLDMIIHVGVGHDGPLRLESLASNSPYLKTDISGSLPPENECISGLGKACIKTNIDLGIYMILNL
jgi:pyroglutamyl-peptidase